MACKWRFSIGLSFIFGSYILCAVKATSSDPCGIGWKYSSTSGKCYKFMQFRKQWSGAESNCTGYREPEATDKTKLATITSEEDMAAVISAANTNREAQWINGKMRLGNYRWPDGSLITASPYWDTSAGSGDCVTLRLIDVVKDGKWSTSRLYSAANCSGMTGFFCEYQAKRCALNELVSNGYSASTMDLIPNRTTVGSAGVIRCKDGFYRDSELTPQHVTPGPNGLAPNHFSCSGTAATDQDPNNYRPEMQIGKNSQGTSSFDTCKPIECSVPDFNVSNVVQQPVIEKNTATGFRFNSSLDVNCTKGFVRHDDPTSTKSAMICKQSRKQPQRGYWFPGDYIPCVGVRCNLTELLEMKPFRGDLKEAINKKTGNRYDGVYQRSQLNRYNNIVTVECNPGYFFDDRSPTKSVLCSLKDGSLTVGAWKGYQGSKIPLPKACEEVTCRYQEVQVKDSDNFLSEFAITLANGTIFKTDTHDGDDYKFTVKIRFFCKSGFETANQRTDQNVTCGPQGTWQPQLTSCIERTATLNTGGRKHYEPEPQDAPAAKQVGAVVIVILVLFLVLIIILDLSTLARDIKIMRHNIRYLRDRMAYKRQL